MTLPRGHALVLYTDGVIEAKRGRELLGEHGLLEALGPDGALSAHELAEAVRDAATTFAPGLRDDLQVLVLRRPALVQGEEEEHRQTQDAAAPTSEPLGSISQASAARPAAASTL